eukprot:TRINITY_DN30513_c0_g1_i1.p1 TRINITY_DN30513_c0_g1~~TRINITY_DN30513_c0_g1_i1.p1  ORF type:complete len:210 (+),score=73.66 TRINITY_DN30513_c0_g1_i1:36-665(+)
MNDTVLADILRRLEYVERRLGIAAPVRGSEAPVREERNVLKETQGQTQEECSICFEGLKKDVYTLSCGHRFHVVCISKALSRTGNVQQICGVCGVQLSHEEVRQVNKAGFNYRTIHSLRQPTKVPNERKRHREESVAPSGLHTPGDRLPHGDSWFDEMQPPPPPCSPTDEDPVGSTMSQFDRLLNYSHSLKRPKTAVPDVVLHNKLLKG